MTDAVPNLDIASVWSVASRALDKANDVAVKQAIAETKMEQHLVWCIQAREQDRLDALAWRSELGKRLDRSDGLMWRASIAIIALLLTVVGFLVSHGAVKFG